MWSAKWSSTVTGHVDRRTQLTVPVRFFPSIPSSFWKLNTILDQPSIYKLEFHVNRCQANKPRRSKNWRTIATVSSLIILRLRFNVRGVAVNFQVRKKEISPLPEEAYASGGRYANQEQNDKRNTIKLVKCEHRTCKRVIRVAIISQSWIYEHD